MRRFVTPRTRRIAGQPGTAIGTVETEAQTVPLASARVCWQRTAVRGRLPAARKVTYLPTGELRYEKNLCPARHFNKWACQGIGGFISSFGRPLADCALFQLPDVNRAQAAL